MMRSSAVASLALTALLFLACGDDKSTGPEIPSPSTLSAVGTIPDSATVGTTLTEPIRVRVTDGEGRPMSGINVTWSVVSGGGSLSEASTATDAAGEAGVTWTLGTEPGENEARATVQGLDPVAFKIRGVAPEPEPEPGPEPVKEPATLVLTADSARLGEGEALKFEATVFDAAGDEIPDARITWSSSDTAVATVDSTGNVSALAEGVVEIIAEAGAASDTTIVTVLGVIAYIESGRVYVIHSDGSGRKPLNVPGHKVSWSPDGSKLVVRELISGVPPVRTRFYIIDADGTNQVPLTDGTTHDEQPAWSPDGTKIAFHSIRTGKARIYVMDVDGSNITLLTDTTSFYGDANPAWSPDGSRIAYTHGTNLHVMDANGKNARKLVDGFSASPAWSPDGSRIAFSLQNRDDGLFKICIVPVEIGPMHCIPSEGVHDRDPTWSPDGERIAFERQRVDAAPTQIYEVDLDAADPNPVRITDGMRNSGSPAWRPRPKR